MATRAYALASQVDGINLMRSKGGASKSSLFDLKNGWVTSKRTIKARPGSVKDLVFPSGTKGVVGFENKFHTFSATTVSGSYDSRIKVNIVPHPTGGAATVLKVHRAFPFLGRLYAVVEFTDGVVQHYWIEDPPAWTANTAVSYGSVVRPTVDDGRYFENLTASTVAAWQANTNVAINDYRQPRVANGLRYKLTAATGTAPYRTSNTEPKWPTTVGATVLERRYITTTQTIPGTDLTTGGGQPPIGGGSNTEYGPFPYRYDPFGDSNQQ